MASVPSHPSEGRLGLETAKRLASRRGFFPSPSHKGEANRPAMIIEGRGVPRLLQPSAPIPRLTNPPGRVPDCGDLDSWPPAVLGVETLTMFGFWPGSNHVRQSLPQNWVVQPRNLTGVMLFHYSSSSVCTSRQAQFALCAWPPHAHPASVSPGGQAP